MRTVIGVAVHKSSSLSGQYVGTVIFSDGSAVSGRAAGHSAGEAAAWAMDKASTRRGKISTLAKITAPPEVMSEIPALVKKRMER